MSLSRSMGVFYIQLGVFFLSLVSFCFSSDALSDDSVPEWPLEVLTASERTARIDFFLNKKSFVFKETNFSHEQEICNSSIEKIKSKSYRVIAPEYVFRKSDLEKDVLYSCGEEIDTLFIPNNDIVRFEFKVNPKFNREHYNLSEFFSNGREVWGLLSEGGVLECSEEKKSVCERQIGYKKYAYSIGSVFDKQSCEILIGPSIKVDKRLIASGRNPNHYKSNPSVYAFLDVDGSLYRLALSIKKQWNNFEEIIADGSSVLVLDNVTEGVSCLFVTKDLDK